MRVTNYKSCLLLVLLAAFIQMSCLGGSRVNEVFTLGSERGIINSFDGVAISYESVGTGDVTLVFVHGWSCDRSYWREQVDTFSEDFRVVTIDLAGHGESGTDRTAWTIASYGTDVAVVVDQLDLKRVVLIGHSMGGDVVVSAARLLGDRVVGLVWVDGYSRLGVMRSAEQIEVLMSLFRKSFSRGTYTFVRKHFFLPTSNSDLVERIARDMAAAPPHVAIPSLRSSITNDRVVVGELKKLDLPVVSVNRASSNPDASSFQEQGVEVLLVENVGHFIMMEDPEAFNVLLRGILARML
jgi:pimeloyl-ACP methyl ester carboxylesterase